MKFFYVDMSRTSTRVGGAIGFIFFLIVGVIPSLLLGGHFGRIIFEFFSGRSIENDSTILPMIYIGGGMVIGLMLGLVACVWMGVMVGGSVNTEKSDVQNSDQNS